MNKNVSIEKKEEYLVLPFKVALKRGMGPTTTIVGRLNKNSHDKVFTTAFVKGYLEDSGKQFPIGCYIQFMDKNNNESYGFYINKSVYMIESWIQKKFGPITEFGGSKRYPKSFLTWINENYPPTEWIKQKYGE